MKDKNITIEDLAGMIKRGFDETATKTEMNQRFEEIDERFDKVDKRFDKIDDRLEKIEKLILADHKRRIEKLENQMQEMRGLLAIG